MYMASNCFQVLYSFIYSFSIKIPKLSSSPQGRPVSYRISVNIRGLLLNQEQAMSFILELFKCPQRLKIQELKLLPKKKFKAPLTLRESLRSARASYHKGKGRFLGSREFRHKRMVFLEQDDLETKDFILTRLRTNSYSQLLEVCSETTHQVKEKIRLKNSLH